MTATHEAQFLITGHKWDCPVPQCLVRPATKYGLQRHFMFPHQGESVDIPGKGVYPQCGHCGIQVAPTVSGYHGHETSAMCRLGTERRT